MGDGASTAAIVTGTPPATTDNSGMVTLTASYTSGDSFHLGVVTYTAVEP